VEGAYEVEVLDSLGCKGSVSNNLTSYSCEFAMPNIINTYYTSSNDYFNITDIHGCVIKSDITIFDRWGNVVYRSNDGLSSWDGKFNGREVEQGVYVFIFNYTAEDADKQQFEEVISGDITVIR
jgi:gliding motility-associated-like protein